MLTFIKLGGSLITDKTVPNTFRPDEAAGAADAIHAALDHDGDLQLLIGHGSGSFGHVAAKAHNTMAGVSSPEAWRGFAQVATAAGELNALMAKTLQTAGIPVWRLQPSASALSRDGQLESMALHPIEAALSHGLVPLVYGDVSLDSVRGGTIISTETIFFYLAQHLPVARILLLGEVDGVYDGDGTVIPSITPKNLGEVEAALGGSSGTDVTGGMETKVRDMIALVQGIPRLEIRIMSGRDPVLLRATLTGEAQPGTLLSI